MQCFEEFFAATAMKNKLGPGICKTYKIVEVKFEQKNFTGKF